jgi:hypothetical protein
MSSASSSPSEAPRAPVRYQIPTHLNVPDKIAIPLLGLTVHVTIRQGLIFLLGWSTAFHLWRQLAPLSTYGRFGEGLRVVIPILLAVSTCIVALLRFADRSLEEWAVLLLRYVRQPRISIWATVSSPLPPQEATPGTETSVHAHGAEEEETSWL